MGDWEESEGRRQGKRGEGRGEKGRVAGEGEEMK